MNSTTMVALAAQRPATRCTGNTKRPITSRNQRAVGSKWSIAVTAHDQTALMMACNKNNRWRVFDMGKWGDSILLSIHPPMRNQPPLINSQTGVAVTYRPTARPIPYVEAISRPNGSLSGDFGKVLYYGKYLTIKK